MHLFILSVHPEKYLGQKSGHSGKSTAFAVGSASTRCSRQRHLRAGRSRYPPVGQDPAVLFQEFADELVGGQQDRQRLEKERQIMKERERKVLSVISLNL